MHQIQHKVVCLLQGLKKLVPSSHPGQVDFPAGQVTFILTWLVGKGSGKLSAN